MIKVKIFFVENVDIKNKLQKYFPNKNAFGRINDTQHSIELINKTSIF